MNDQKRQSLQAAVRIIGITAALFIAALSAWAFVVLGGTAPEVRLVFAAFFAGMIAFMVHMAVKVSNPPLSRTAGLLSSVFALAGLILLLIWTRGL